MFVLDVLGSMFRLYQDVGSSLYSMPLGFKIWGLRFSGV